MDHDDQMPTQHPGDDAVDPQAQAMQWIRDDLDAMAIEEAADAGLYLALAARLGVLGDWSRFDGWERNPRLGGRRDLLEGLRERARIGRWDLRHAEGMLLGRALIDASDFNILRLVDAERGGLLAGATLSLQAWAEDAEEAVLDDEAADEVRTFGDLYPIPEKYRLEVMHEPLGDFERAVLSALPATTSVELCAFVHEPEFALDLGKPTDRMKTRIAARKGRIEFPGGRWLDVFAVLTDAWELKICIDAAGGDRSLLDEVIAARAGGFALAKAASNSDPMTDEWDLALMPLGVDARSRVLNQTFGIALADGRRFRL